MTTIGNKADHVRQALAADAATKRCDATHGHYLCALPAGHDGKHKPAHTCHWPGCGKPVPAAAWGCKRHWYTLPQYLRTLIWSTYLPGQEISKTPSTQYVDAARQVQDWIAKNHPPAPQQLDL